ncbi:MAG: four helix bundle protein [Acidobacteriota bacterium]|nr:four helix bundle protein [Acidobacteriota bacterium]MDQ3088900.1 four helix bundle protein [Acidobacteriota bacterium]
MKDNPILEKSFTFALRIVRLYRYLVEEKKEYILSKELLTSGTHIGKHVKEAVDAESRQVFISEMGIARRKASETEYWLQLLFQSDLLTEKQFVSIEADRQEIFKLLTSIVETSKENV